MTSFPDHEAWAYASFRRPLTLSEAERLRLAELPELRALWKIAPDYPAETLAEQFFGVRFRSERNECVYLLKPASFHAPAVAFAHLLDEDELILIPPVYKTASPPPRARHPCVAAPTSSRSYTGSPTS